MVIQVKLETLKQQKAEIAAGWGLWGLFLKLRGLVQQEEEVAEARRAAARAAKEAEQAASELQLEDRLF